MFDVSLMRLIDDKAGNLACNVLAYKKRLLSLFGGTKSGPRTEYKKIAVMKFFGLGSIVVASPAMAALREAFPNAEIYFVSFKSNREIVEMLGFSDKNFYIDSSSPQAFAQSTAKVAWDLRREGVDLAIDFEFFAKFPLVLSGLANIPSAAGFYLTQEHWRRALLDIPGSYNHYYHTKDIFLSLIYLLRTGDLYYVDFEKFREKYSYPRVEPRREDLKAVRDVLAAKGVNRGSRLIVLNPNAAIDLAPEIRKWPEERYTELVTQILAEYPDATVLGVGARSEKEYVERVMGRARSARAISLAGDLSLRQVLALFSLTDLFVTNDSGPMHLACLVDAPIVGLFFADTPTVFAPLASRTAVVVPPLYAIPMFTVYNGKDAFAGRPLEAVANVPAQTVTVDQVMTKVRELLHAEPWSSSLTAE